MVPNYTIIYRKVKYPRIELKTGDLRFIVPFGTDVQKIFSKHKKWILSKKRLIDKYRRNYKDLPVYNRTDQEFRSIIETLLNKYQREFNLKIKNTIYRKMRTKWASCTKKGNIVVNTIMKNLPLNLLKYIIYHEVIHLFEKRHNIRFWNLIAKKFPDYRDLESLLFPYWFLVIGN